MSGCALGCDPSEFTEPVWLLVLWGCEEAGAYAMCEACARQRIRHPRVGEAVYSPKGERYPARFDPQEARPSAKSGRRRPRI
jgi:hypothetical protein